MTIHGQIFGAREMWWTVTYVMDKSWRKKQLKGQIIVIDDSALTNEDKILEMLRQHEPPEKIHAAYKSLNQYYRALRRYIPEADQQILPLQHQLQALQSQIKTGQEHVTSLTTQHTHLQQQIDRLEAQRTYLTQAITGVEPVSYTHLTLPTTPYV